MATTRNGERSYNWVWVAALCACLGTLDATHNVFAMRHEGMHHSWVKMFFALGLAALRAFDAGALDYLLKPFDDSRLHLAMQRAKQKIGALEPLPSQEMQRLEVRSTGQVAYVQIPDIDWVEAADYYVCLHVGAKSHLLRKSMAELERELDPQIFCRIHRSTIVNLRRVHGLVVDDTGEYEVILASGKKLRLSRRFRKDVQSRMREFGAPPQGAS